MTKALPAIILVAPQMGENIGAAARAMANFGLKDLRLVAPRDGWPSQTAEANAVGAFDHLNPIEVFDTTADALKPYHTIYATTARPRDMRKKVLTPHSAALEITASPAQKSAILFGGERAGLTNEDIALAHHIISVPVNPDFASLNLAQCVLLVAYQLKLCGDDTPAIEMPLGDSARAPHGDQNDFMMRLETELQEKHFFRNPDMKPTMMRNIRNMFARCDMTDQELRTLHGILSALRGNKTNI